MQEPFPTLDLRDAPGATILLQAFASLPQAVAVLDDAGTILVTNRRWEREEAMGVHSLICAPVGEDFEAACRSSLGALAAVGQHVADGLSRVLKGRVDRFELQYAVNEDDDNSSWYLITVTNLEGVGAVVTHHDTTVHHTVHEVLTDLAFHDPLTGLPNRSLVLDRLRMTLIRAHRTQLRPVVVFLDLNGFKAVNDRLGHDAGDVVLKEVAQRLSSTVREQDTCGRWGGDEFVLVVELTDPAAVDRIIERTLETLRDPIRLDSGDVQLGMSIGVVLAHGTERADQLVRLADKAMYDAKRTGDGVRVSGSAT